MDSLTQIVLGASVAAVVVPAAHRRAALLAGAALGTLPDLDGIPVALMTDDPVLRMTLHRGLTHSLLVLPLAAAAIWWLFRRFGKGRVATSPARWFWAIQLALVTHPLLDAFTVYGTQLLWPFPPHPAMWSSLFIIDPLYTVWLLSGVLVAAFAGPRLLGRRAIVVGLALSTAYLGWPHPSRFAGRARWPGLRQRWRLGRKPHRAGRGARRQPAAVVAPGRGAGASSGARWGRRSGRHVTRCLSGRDHWGGVKRPARQRRSTRAARMTIRSRTVARRWLYCTAVRSRGKQERVCGS